VVTAGHGDAAMPVIRNPVDYSATPPSYPLPPPAVDEHGDQIRAWLAEPKGRGAAWGEERRKRRGAGFATSDEGRRRR
jgi:hypothetical protein